MKPTIVRLFEQGFKNLVSVIPPNAPLSPLSRIQPSQRGKTPGRKNRNGTWGGYDWLKYAPTADDVRQWADDGANVGLLAAHYPGVDIDSTDPDLAAMVRKLALETLGDAPTRVGRPPKCLLMYRTNDPFARMAAVIHWRGGKHLVEVLGHGRQYLIDGLHPMLHRYEWDRDITALGDPARWLTKITREDVERFLNVLTEHFAALEVAVERVGDGSIRERSSQPQAELLAPDMGALQEAVDCIPNSDDLFPGREDYIKMGYAIRAASGAEHEEQGFEVFASWAARHVSDARVEGNPDTWRSDWRKMAPPYAVGWQWIAEMAGNFGFNRAAYEFEAADAAREEIEESERPPELSEQWLADKVIEENGHLLRYVPALSRFYVWDGARWEPDALLRADHLIGSSLRRLGAILMRRGVTPQEQAAARKQATQLCSANTLYNVRSLLRSDPRVAAPAEAFDADPWILNTPGGIVDLKTGELRPHDPAKMCSRVTVATPDPLAPSPLWSKFLVDATGGDLALERYLQRLAGYALTGTTLEQMLAFIWGPGGNGKSVFLNTLEYVMNDYAEMAAMDTFAAATGDRHPTDLAGLVGARLVMAVETQAGRKWDEQRLKALTGGDPIRARFMRQDFFTYQPQFTLVIIGNHTPEIPNLDDALRRRIHIVPFTVRPPTIDEHLKEKLREEAPAILAWMVEGCLRWQRDKLMPPETVLSATRDYFDGEDAVGRFLTERCDLRPDFEVSLDELYRAWREWTGVRGEDVGSLKRFSQRLLAHQLKRGQDAKTRKTTIRGVQLRADTLEEAVQL